MSWLQFQRIYAINLPARTDRRDGLSLVSSLTGIQLDWVDGVDGHDVPDKALPYPASREAISNANIGSWRAHLNTLKDIVAGDQGSALILEDDVDWDIRIREQLQDFALTSRALHQPLASPPHSFAHPTLRDPPRTTDMPKDIDFDQLPPTIPPS
ncbi:glycosyltransferase family 25 protein [Aspergillus sp. HF37]|nr:glycosyltransferase family 25 protein [Aspergillus sp. HF37]